MNIRSNNIHIFVPISLVLLIFVLCIVLFTVSTPQKIQGQHWPIPASDGLHFNRLNCTFGELHGGLRFHGAIDIDNDAALAEAILHGQVFEPGGYPNTDANYIGIEHESVAGSGNYDRRSIYMHITPNNFGQDDPIQTGENVGAILPGQGHLHLETWELINGVWYTINPLKNDQDWSVVQLTDNQGQVIGYFGKAPVDGHDPQVNQVFLKGIAQSNSVASGYQILTSIGGLAYFPNSNNNQAVRMHFINRDGASSSGIPSYNSVEDKLAMFGNIVTSAHCMDEGINTTDSNSMGEALTLHRMMYSVDDDENLLDNDEIVKYDITFDKFLIENELPRTVDDDEDIFHRHYNDLSEQNSDSEYKYGNNDYIRLYNAGTAALNDCVDPNCPTDYLLPHKPVDGIQSNGVWFTKAREGTAHVFTNTTSLTAAVSAEALYPDGEHTLTFHVEDAAGRIDRAPNGREDNAKVKVIVDNFRPYVQDVKITSGSDTFPMYSSAWNWETATRELKLRPNAVDKKADMGQPLHIAVTTSEPMKLTTDANGQPNGNMKIKLFARDPDDPDRMTISIV